MAPTEMPVFLCFFSRRRNEVELVDLMFAVVRAPVGEESDAKLLKLNAPGSGID